MKNTGPAQGGIFTEGRETLTDYVGVSIAVFFSRISASVSKSGVYVTDQLIHRVFKPVEPVKRPLLSASE